MKKITHRYQIYIYTIWNLGLRTKLSYIFILFALRKAAKKSYFFKGGGGLKLLLLRRKIFFWRFSFYLLKKFRLQFLQLSSRGGGVRTFFCGFPYLTLFYYRKWKRTKLNENVWKSLEFGAQGKLQVGFDRGNVELLKELCDKWIS